MCTESVADPPPPPPPLDRRAGIGAPRDDDECSLGIAHDSKVNLILFYI